VLTRRPNNKPAFMTVTQAGLIAYIGMSEAGMAACLNSLPAPARAVGVPHYFTLRRVFEGRSLDHAVSVIADATRAIPANIMLSTPDGPANLEVTIDDVNVLRPEAGRGVAPHESLSASGSRCPSIVSFPS
jgi:isopenicillin-N N-acyltransferase-like protein